MVTLPTTYRTVKGTLVMTIDSSKEFGIAVRKARKALRLTQPELAGGSGVGIRFIVDLEHGKSTCELDKALRVASMLGLDLEFKSRHSPE
jgi:y4mF family transcriptional regulator